MKNDKIKDKEKQVEEILKDIRKFIGYDTPYTQKKALADYLFKHYQPKLSQDCVVLSKEEYEKGIIQTGYIEELEKDKKAYQGMNLNLLNKIEELELKLKQASKKTAEKFSKTIKEEIFSILSSKKTGFVNKEEVEFCTTMTKQILYQINKHLNEDYGFNMPLFAENQFLAELELAKQFNVEIKE